MKFKFLIYIQLFAFLFFNYVSLAQELGTYINQALESNLALKQKEESYEKSILALKEARGMFLPNISVNARYTVAQGGRTIDFPVGDLLNPVYSTLNELTQLNFPTIENEEFPFLRPTEQETKLRLVQPIFNPEIRLNTEIKNDLTHVQKASLDMYKRELVNEVKSAYYKYWQTVEVLELIEQTRDLLNENVRVNEKLFNNDMVTADNLYVARAELSRLDQKQADAQKNNLSARSYFNFLLNRDLNHEISPDSVVLNFQIQHYNLNDLVTSSLDNREEIIQLEYYDKVNGNLVKLNRSKSFPNVTGVVDYGIQGETYSFTSNDDFIMASVVLQWDLFKGRQNKRKIEQARLDGAIIRNKLEEAKRQINLEIINAYYSLDAAYKNIVAAEAVYLSAEKAFRMVNKQYGQGQVSLAGYMDARNSFTSAGQELIIARYNYLIQLSNFEKTTCLYEFKNEEYN